jgi:Nucleotidyl transferase AbiEii toxin, Type IV TA system
VEQIDGVPMISLPDTLAMKLHALANRGSKKDFFDFDEWVNPVPLP